MEYPFQAILQAVQSQTGMSFDQLARSLGLKKESLAGIAHEPAERSLPVLHPPNAMYNLLSRDYGTARQRSIVVQLDSDIPPGTVTLADARTALSDAIALLDLKPYSLAKLFMLSESELIGFMRSESSPGWYTIAVLQQWNGALSVLTHLFDETRIKDIVRRPAELFGGETALDLILRGGLPEVAAKYDQSLQYTR